MTFLRFPASSPLLLCLFSFILTSGIRVPCSADNHIHCLGSPCWWQPKVSPFPSPSAGPCSVEHGSLALLFSRNSPTCTVHDSSSGSSLSCSLPFPWRASLPVSPCCSFPVFSVAPRPISPSTSRWHGCIGKGRWQELIPEGPPRGSPQRATDTPSFLTKTLSLPYKEISAVSLFATPERLLLAEYLLD